MTDERALMFDVQNGQLDKLAILFERNHLQLFNYFLRTGNNRAASEDLVQETFMKVLAYRSSFSGTANFKSWLFGIARNTKADYYRKSKQATTHLDIDEHDVGSEQTLGEEMEQWQKQDLFERALASINPELREIIVLSRFHQLNYEDIAQMHDCNLNTMKSRMRKGLTMLEQAYRKLAGEPNQ